MEYVFVRQNGWTSGYLEVQSVAGNSNYFLSETNDDGITITWQPSNITTPRPWRIVGLHKVVSEISQADPAGPTFVELTNAERVAGSTTDVEFTFSTASKHHYDNNTRIITPSFDQRTFTGDSSVNTIGFDINGPLYLLGARSPDAGVFLWENGLLLNDLDLVAYQGEIYRLDTTNGTATAPLEIVDLGDVIVQSVADLPMPIASPTNNYAVSDPIGTLATAAGSFTSGLLTLNLSNLPTISVGVNYVFDSGTGTITAPITRFVLRFGGDRITVVSASQITINLAASSTLSTVEELVGAVPTAGGTFDGNAELPPQLREAGGAGTGYGVGNLVRLLYQDGSNGPGLWQVSSDGTSWVAANDTVKPTDALATAFGWVNTDDTILHDPRFPTDTSADRISNGSFLRWDAVNDIWIETTPSEVWDAVFSAWNPQFGYVQRQFVVDTANGNRLFRALNNFAVNTNPFGSAPVFASDIVSFEYQHISSPLTDSNYAIVFANAESLPAITEYTLPSSTITLSVLQPGAGTRILRFSSFDLVRDGNRLRIRLSGNIGFAPGSPLTDHPTENTTFSINGSSISTNRNQPPSYEVDNQTQTIRSRWEEYSGAAGLNQFDIENSITDDAGFRNEIGINNGSITGQILSWNNATEEWVVSASTEDTIEDWNPALDYIALVSVVYNGELYRTTSNVTASFAIDTEAGSGLASNAGVYNAAQRRWEIRWDTPPTLVNTQTYIFSVGSALFAVLGADIEVSTLNTDFWNIPTGGASFRYVTTTGFTETSDPTSDRTSQAQLAWEATTLPPPRRLQNEWDRVGPPRTTALAWAIASTGQFAATTVLATEATNFNIVTVAADSDPTRPEITVTGINLNALPSPPTAFIARGGASPGTAGDFGITDGTTYQIANIVSNTSFTIETSGTNTGSRSQRPQDFNGSTLITTLNPYSRDIVRQTDDGPVTISNITAIHYDGVINAELPGTAGNVTDWYEWVGVEMNDPLDPSQGFTERSARSVYSTSGDSPLAAGATTIPAF